MATGETTVAVTVTGVSGSGETTVVVTVSNPASVVWRRTAGAWVPAQLWRRVSGSWSRVI